MAGGWCREAEEDKRKCRSSLHLTADAEIVCRTCIPVWEVVVLGVGLV